MGTLEQLLAQYGLNDNQVKVASEQTSTTNDEVEQVLESLGLDGASEGVEKVASTNDTKGDRMSLTGIYEEFFGGAPAMQKEAQAENISSEEVNEGTQLFGEVSAHYYEVARANFIDKIAGSVEDEADQDEEQPMKNMGNTSSLGATLGKAQDPHMPVNHSASGGEAMKTMTGNSSPYSLKELALKKAILKRLMAQSVGEIKD